jgi:hypothetical protein
LAKDWTVTLAAALYLNELCYDLAPVLMTELLDGCALRLKAKTRLSLPNR